MIEIKQINWAHLRSFFLRKDAADSTAYKLTTNGLDVSGAEITNVGAATADTSAPNLGQVKQLVAEGDYRGMIHGYVKVVSSAPYFYLDNGSGVTTGNSTATANRLYIVLEDMTIASVAYQANDVIWYDGSSFICDNTRGTFDASSAAADVGGSLARCSYNIKINSLAGHEIPGYASGYGAFTDGTYIKWNAEYDSSADNNSGRWNFFGSEGNVPIATTSTLGKVKAGDGIAISSGVVSAAIEIDRGLSWAGATPYKTYGLHVVTSIFEFISGALSIKSGVFAAASHTHTAADVPKRGLFRDTYTNKTLTAAGSSINLTLSYVVSIPNGVTDTYKCFNIYINGVLQSFATSNNAPVLAGQNLTIKRDGLSYSIETTDVIDVVYIPGT